MAVRISPGTSHKMVLGRVQRIALGMDQKMALAATKGTLGLRQKYRNSRDMAFRVST
jgi:hypothetical protein